MNNITLNGSTISSMKEFHRILAKALSFPEWYGMNLDALYDCLTDISEETSVTLNHALEWFQHFGKDAITAVRVMQDVSQFNPHFHFYFGADQSIMTDNDDEEF